jgi:hypothetical protein
MDYEKIMQQIYDNQETAIRLLKENVELKQKAKLYEILIEDVAGRLVMEKEDGKIITDDERKNYLQIAIEKNMEYILKEIKNYE